MLLATTITLLFALQLATRCTSSVIPGAYIIEYADDNANNHENFLSSLGPLSSLFKVQRTYSSPIFNGVSIRLTDTSAEEPKISGLKGGIVSNVMKHPVLEHLLSNPAVGKIYPVNEVPRPKFFKRAGVAVPQELPYPDDISQLKTIRERFNLRGSGITIGILDSGVDYNHPALGGGFGDGYKIRLGYNLVDPAKDDQEAGTHRPPEDPYDVCKGEDGIHGTHVTGIIGGVDPSKNFEGVASNATLGMWRIFGCTGGAGEDLVIKAMEMAHAAGCDILSMSLGIQNGWPESAMSVVADRLVKSGTLVVSVAGNQGDEGAFMANTPGVGKSALAIASVDNSVRYSEILVIDKFPDENYPYSLSTNTTVNDLVNGTLTIITQPYDMMTAIKACNDTDIPQSAAVDGNVLLVARGDCTYDQKVQVAARAGATQVIIFDPNAEEPKFIPEAKITMDNAIPSLGITTELGQQLLLFHAMQPQTDIHLTFPVGRQRSPMETAGQISDFSSVGPSYELDLKPNLAGIGGDVFSTFPLHSKGDGWGVLSGTSMAAPHVAGAAALLLEYYKKNNQQIDPIYLTEQLQNTASLSATFEGQPEHPLLLGAGLIRPLDAMLSTLHISPATLSFNDTANLIRTQELQIHNGGRTPVSLTFSNLQAKSIKPYNDSSFVISEPATRGNAAARLRFSPAEIYLQAEASTTVQVSVYVPPLNDYQMYGGYIRISSIDNEQLPVAHVPYFGVLGELKQLPIFDDGFPYIAPANDPNTKYSEEDTFIFNGVEPTIVFRLLTPSAQVHIEVLDEGKSRTLGQIDGGPFIYWERNRLSEENYYQPINWNGKIVQDYTTNSTATALESGTYYIRVRALKLLGGPDDWEEWISGPILV